MSQTEPDLPMVSMRFLSTEDDVAIANSIANHVKRPVLINLPDGRKHLVIPMETGVFETAAPAVQSDMPDKVPEELDATGTITRDDLLNAMAELNSRSAKEFDRKAALIGRGPPNHPEDDIPPHPGYGEFGG